MEFLKIEYTSEVHAPEDKYRVGASAHIIDKRREHDAEITESLDNGKITCRSRAAIAVKCFERE